MDVIEITRGDLLAGLLAAISIVEALFLSQELENHRKARDALSLLRAEVELLSTQEGAYDRIPALVYPQRAVDIRSASVEIPGGYILPVRIWALPLILAPIAATYFAVDTPGSQPVQFDPIALGFVATLWGVSLVIAWAWIAQFRTTCVQIDRTADVLCRAVREANTAQQPGRQHLRRLLLDLSGIEEFGPQSSVVLARIDKSGSITDISTDTEIKVNDPCNVLPGRGALRRVRQRHAILEFGIANTVRRAWTVRELHRLAQDFSTDDIEGLFDPASEGFRLLTSRLETDMSEDDFAGHVNAALTSSMGDD